MATKGKQPVIPDLNKIVNDINNLVYQPGYLYSLLTISLHDLFLPLENYVDVNWWDRISYQELGYLFGLLIKKPLQIGVYPSQQDLQKQRPTDSSSELRPSAHGLFRYSLLAGLSTRALEKGSIVLQELRHSSRPSRYRSSCRTVIDLPPQGLGSPPTSPLSAALASRHSPRTGQRRSRNRNRGSDQHASWRPGGTPPSNDSKLRVSELCAVRTRGKFRVGSFQRVSLGLRPSQADL